MNELFSFLFACVLIGIWGLEMFCDSPYLEFSRAIRPTKNTTALTIPTFGSLMLVIAAAKTLERCWGKLPNAASSFVLTYCAIGIFVFIVSLFPINLPRVMYPEYQAEKRRLNGYGVSTNVTPCLCAVAPRFLNRVTMAVPRLRAKRRTRGADRHRIRAHRGDGYAR